MYKWQQNILDKMSKFKGRGLVTMTGRGGTKQFSNNARFWFRDQRDRDWFTLRWSS